MAEPGSTDAVVELLEGVISAVLAEAENAHELDVGYRLHLLLADVLDACDDLDKL